MCPRSHDGQLRKRLAAAVAEEAPLLVVVRGESCTGKTRTAAEALKAAVPDDFQLLFPASADDLLAALAAGALGQRSVLWLNEAQNYLNGPAGETVTAALLRRLNGDGPFIAPATLWPDYDKALTAVPDPDADGTILTGRPGCCCPKPTTATYPAPSPAPWTPSAGPPTRMRPWPQRWKPKAPTSPRIWPPGRAWSLTTSTRPARTASTAKR
ncbi:hypothetical protein [Streptomyces lavendulocolor]|uniref:hypothetical protein n=1 Tax=Streptomyces lavendulocolor TaxID=67316 RepID=UPI003C2EC74A